MKILKDALEVRPTDRAFTNSPDTGDPACLCSRCGQVIQYRETPIRQYTTNERGKVDRNSLEYRYCEFCMSGVKYFPCQMDFEFASRCQKPCGECEHLNNEPW